jgi:hypothetical protein
LKCGNIPGVYSTVDFGVQVDPKKAFAAQRAFSPKGPLVFLQMFNFKYLTNFIICK